MGCNPCQQINERNRNTNNNDIKNIKEVKYDILYEKNGQNPEMLLTNRSCNIYTNYNLEKLEKEIAKVDNNNNINNNEIKKQQEIKKEENDEKKSSKKELYNIANNGDNVQKINVSNNINPKENKNEKEEGHQFIIVDDNELVPSQSINGTNIFVINSEKNTKVSNGKSFKSIKASSKYNIGNNLEGIIREELEQ